MKTVFGDFNLDASHSQTCVTDFTDTLESFNFSQPMEASNNHVISNNDQIKCLSLKDLF